MTMGATERIKEAAARLGACSKAARAESIASLAELFFSPQGKEFCAEHNFPSLQAFRELDRQELADNGIYVDSGAVSAYNKANISLVGETRGELACNGPDCKHTIVLMHGAEANIKLRNYAVAEIIAIGCKAEIDKDETSILL